MGDVSAARRSRGLQDVGETGSGRGSGRGGAVPTPVARFATRGAGAGRGASGKASPSPGRGPWGEDSPRAPDSVILGAASPASVLTPGGGFGGTGTGVFPPTPASLSASRGGGSSRRSRRRSPDTTGMSALEKTALVQQAAAEAAQDAMSRGAFGPGSTSRSRRSNRPPTAGEIAKRAGLVGEGAGAEAAAQVIDQFESTAVRLAAERRNRAAKAREEGRKRAVVIARHMERQAAEMDRDRTRQARQAKVLELKQEMDDKQLKDRLATIEAGDRMYAKVHARKIRPVEDKRRRDAATMHREWERKVYGTIQGSIRRKIDSRQDKQGQKERQRAMDAYLRATSAGQAVLLDQAGPDYDPWAFREGPVMVRGTGKGGRIVDPTKRVFAAAAREKRLVSAGKSAAAFARAFKEKMGESSDLEHQEEQGMGGTMGVTSNSLAGGMSVTLNGASAMLGNTGGIAGSMTRRTANVNTIAGKDMGRARTAAAGTMRGTTTRGRGGVAGMAESKRGGGRDGEGGRSGAGAGAGTTVLLGGGLAAGQPWPKGLTVKAATRMSRLEQRTRHRDKFSTSFKPLAADQVRGSSGGYDPRKEQARFGSAPGGARAAGGAIDDAASHDTSQASRRVGYSPRSVLEHARAGGPDGRIKHHIGGPGAGHQAARATGHGAAGRWGSGAGGSGLMTGGALATRVGGGAGGGRGLDTGARGLGQAPGGGYLAGTVDARRGAG